MNGYFIRIRAQQLPPDGRFESLYQHLNSNIILPFILIDLVSYQPVEQVHE